MIIDWVLVMADWVLVTGDMYQSTELSITSPDSIVMVGWYVVKRIS